MITHQSQPVKHGTDIGKVRRGVTDLFKDTGNQVFINNISIICNELTSNLIKHTKRGGDILFRRLNRDKAYGLEIISLDQGPGMEESQKMMQDGTSTTGSSGIGMGAIKRLSDYFDVYSFLGKGTAILSRTWNTIPLKNDLLPPFTRISSPGLVLDSVSIPKPRYETTGDEWAFWNIKKIWRLIVVDGTGHGSRASLAARDAIAVFLKNKSDPLEKLIKKIHDKLLATVGASIAVVEIDIKKNSFEMISIGNISLRIFDPKNSEIQCISSGGSVGNRLIHNKTSRYAWTPQSTLIAHTDGIRRFSLDKTVLSKDPVLIAALLFRDFFRGNDDGTVVVVRNQGLTISNIKGQSSSGADASFT